MQAWKPRWRSLGQPQVPAEYVILRDSLPFYEDLGPRGSGEGADSEKAMSRGTGKPLLSQTLEDFSIRTLYDKLEDQNLHVASQLSKHRSDALAFYRATAQQLQGLQDFLQGLSRTEQQALGRGGDPETDPKATAREDTGQSQEPWDSHTAASQRQCQQPPPGRSPSATTLGFQLELDQAIAALASALPQAQGRSARASRKVKGCQGAPEHTCASGQLGEQPPSSCQRDVLLTAQPAPSDEEHQSTRPQQNPGPPDLPQGDAKGRDAESPGPGEWIFEAGHRHGATPELQRKMRQVEDTLDALNEEFFQLSVQALELQKEEDRPNPLPPGEGGMLVVAPSIFPCERQEERPNPLEAGGPGGEKLGIWALKSDKALELEMRRVHLAQRIEDLEWELSLLLQVASGSSKLIPRGSVLKVTASCDTQPAAASCTDKSVVDIVHPNSKYQNVWQ
uniref:uncharacterized protein LOC106993129 n=1 Tax=Macaca mulatta TaxID=9544 RepID=UPI0010A280F8|nr:uncharacterized protein LOC106993129 [Macaca mulatta]